jgi:hypothetical protein
MATIQKTARKLRHVSGNFKISVMVCIIRFVAFLFKVEDAIEPELVEKKEAIVVNNACIDENVVVDLDVSSPPVSILTWAEANARARQLFFEGRRSIVKYNEHFSMFSVFY